MVKARVVDKKVERWCFTDERGAKEKEEGEDGWEGGINKGLHVDGREKKEERERGRSYTKDEERNSYCLASPAFPQYTAQVYRMCTPSPSPPLRRDLVRGGWKHPSHAWSVPYPVSRGPPFARRLPLPSPRLGLTSFGKMNRITLDLYERVKKNAFTLYNLYSS